MGRALFFFGKRISMLKMKEVIIVEGRNDTIKVQQAVHADTIETNGTAINDTVLAQIKQAQETRGVIIFTDPDYPGQRIRQIIDQHIPGCKHAFLTQEQAKDQRSERKNLGIEHASIEDIQVALEKVYERMEYISTDITKEDLLNYGLIGKAGASARREALGKILNIGHVNGKQLLKRLQMFQITKETLAQAMEKIAQEGLDD